MSVRYATLARQDLARIWRDCAERSGIDLAEVLIDRIHDTLRKTLAIFPNAGRSRREFGADIRSFPIVPYVAFCRADDRGVEILRVLHGHRDISEPLLSLLIAV